ncbi:hypothetical protein RTG_03186 [Rhodotorula toruloides ATCC 204091]|uniref:Uncharacterized protein family UPF0029-domain containing protein n=1 Tax=Rhodotorula toruloides TaxID=5286 RepID=A0A2S9ZY80_RHOTO|nr:hypothetical protein RTG_03186 [Rhodotorula toruloides ATCC 204091]PRQ70716.1 Uncharacterized protein family UPF0029-domain containing protein [Rhodotorula toruloides]
MSKRTASSTSFGSSNTPSAKRTSLNAYFPSTTGPPKPPSPLVSSDPLTDRSSTFIAHAAPCTNHTQAQTLQNYVRNLRSTTHPVECTHEIMAYRCMGLKPGKTGLESEDDWKVEINGDDDGEKGGSTIIKEVLTQEGGVDVAIVVSRLYGGVMLGPVRFNHIRACASQALSRLLSAQNLSNLLARLSSLDAEIASHSSSPTKPPSKDQYAGLDEAKAERLVKAREKRLEFGQGGSFLPEEEEATNVGTKEVAGQAGSANGE